MGPPVDGGGRRGRVRLAARAAPAGAGASDACAPATWCCARRACWRCTSRSTRSSSETRVRVWNDEVASRRHGRPGGAVVQRLPRPARAPGALRPRGAALSATRRWTGGTRALTAFADAFSLLVVSSAAIDELNARLRRGARRRCRSDRFRPNLVLDGLTAARGGLDRPHHLRWPDGPVRAAPGQTVHALLDSRRRPASAASRAMPSATNWPPTAPTRA